jgi:acetyl esterase/lipase
VIYAYLPKSPAATPSPAILICPGGGYAGLSMIYEGSNEAVWFRARGMAAFVLKYRLPAKGYRFPVPLLDAQRAIRLIRSRAAEWNIDPAKVGVMGFSAGGHLASTLETHYDAGNPQAPDPVDRLSCRPDFAVLLYPVITMQAAFVHKASRNNLLGPNPDPALLASLSNETQVTPRTPPTFLIAGRDDKSVQPKNSEAMYAALQKAGVPSKLELDDHAPHGFGFGHKPDPSPPGWLDRVAAWLKGQGFMP